MTLEIHGIKGINRRAPVVAVIILVAYHYLFAMYSNLAYVTFILYLSSFFFFL